MVQINGGGVVMRYKLLGKSGLRVSELCLGAMTFGEDWGFGASKQESRKIFDLFIKAGGNFIDTANVYTNGTSEKLVGEFAGANREQLVIATKFTLNTRRNDPNAGGNHRKNIRQSLDASLRRLNTDYVDLYWLHAWDFTTPVEEVMSTLNDLVCQGKVHYIGISDAPAWVVAQANTLAAIRGWTAFSALQIAYSLIERTPERELLPMARAFDMAVTPWAPVGGGILTGKYNVKNWKKNTDTKRADYNESMVTEKNLAIAEKVAVIAKKIGCTPAQAALNWLRRQPGVIIPIVGARTLDQAKDNFECLKHELSNHDVDILDKISQVELGFPHDFLAREMIQDILYGGTAALIDNQRNP